ncbi:hypothetical protein A9Q99_25175 [Gammaproteobacteria bacterium 45_16_T64]|nr:hypothetical protein A9Q99_25175 [Gammaproteobacteria bacterium 45_16_T64]
MNPKQQPNRHVIALITFLALIPLVYFIPDVLAEFLPDNKLLNVTVTVGIIVPIISYIIMPFALKQLARQQR